MKKLIIFVLILLSSLFVLKASAEAPQPTKEERYETDMNSWIDRLVQDESGGNELKVILDSNNKYSHGCLQFQYGTFVGNAAKYHIKGELMSCSVQKQLARAMVEDNYNNWRAWYNSVTKKTAGYPPTKE